MLPSPRKKEYTGVEGGVSGKRVSPPARDKTCFAWLSIAIQTVCGLWCAVLTSLSTNCVISVLITRSALFFCLRAGASTWRWVRWLCRFFSFLLSIQFFISRQFCPWPDFVISSAAPAGRIATRAYRRCCTCVEGFLLLIQHGQIAVRELLTRAAPRQTCEIFVPPSF